MWRISRLRSRLLIFSRVNWPCLQCVFIYCIQLHCMRMCCIPCTSYIAMLYIQLNNYSSILHAIIIAYSDRAAKEHCIQDNLSVMHIIRRQLAIAQYIIYSTSGNTKINIFNRAVYEHAASCRVSSQLAIVTLNCLEFTFSELRGGEIGKSQGTSFGCQNWSGRTDFGGGPIFSLQSRLIDTLIHYTHSQCHYQACLTGLLFWNKFCRPFKLTTDTMGDIQLYVGRVMHGSEIHPSDSETSRRTSKHVSAYGWHFLDSQLVQTLLTEVLTRLHLSTLPHHL